MLMNMLPDWALKPLYIELRNFFADFDGHIELEKPTDIAKRLRKEIDEKQNKLESILKSIADQAESIKKEPDTDYLNRIELNKEKLRKNKFYNASRYTGAGL